MSYDLFLFSPRLNRESFARYFSSRPRYKPSGWYQNEDTGVYFGFNYEDPEPNDGDEPERTDREHVAFNLNYFRPHIFGLEAEPEVTAFVEAFDCTIHDPQLDGMGDGPYSPAGFLRGWNKGNAFGYDAIRGRPGGTENVLFAEGELIERSWRWNLERQARQDRLGDTPFLPHIFWGKNLINGAAINYAVWGEGVVSAIPECATHVVLIRKRRTRTFPIFGKVKEVMQAKLISIEDAGMLGGCRWHQFEDYRVLLAPESLPPSKNVTNAFRGNFGDVKSILKGFSSDHVLNAPARATLG